jgi:hypothetical protein
VIDLPTGEKGTADVPLFALAIGRQDERALTRADQYSYVAHRSLLLIRLPKGLLFAQSIALANVCDTERPEFSLL